ncbi:hypothetical protein HGRIS_013977 [Hohenbuehelia grisea]|uniref:Uncharacterized protein n=1 Tax=Hohenbuehelia grisea TaxID=104357 RepID=A0ABR3JS07_9AGAR
MQSIHSELAEGYRFVSGNKLAEEAQESFRFVLQALLMVVLSSDDEPKLVSLSPCQLAPLQPQGTGVVWCRKLDAVGVQPVLDVATVGENLADHAHSWANAFTKASTTKDILLQNPAFAAEQQAFWLKNRTGLLTALSTSLGVAAPSDIFTESELANLIKTAQANMTTYAQQFSDGNSQL